MAETSSMNNSPDSAPKREDGIIRLNFDNSVKRWNCAVWWRTSHQVETRVLEDLLPTEWLRMNYHEGLMCALFGEQRPVVFNPSPGGGFHTLPEQPVRSNVMHPPGTNAFLGSTSTGVFKVLSARNNFGGYELSLLALEKGAWQRLRYDHPPHYVHSLAKSVSTDNSIYYQAHLSDNHESVLVKVHIEVGVVSIIKLPPEVKRELLRWMCKPPDSPFKLESTILGVYRGRVTIGIKSKIRISTVMFSMESPTSWLKETISAVKFEEDLEYDVQTYFRGFSACGELMIFTMHEVMTDSLGREDRTFEGARAYVVYYDPRTGRFDRQVLEGLSFPPSEPTDSDPVVWVWNYIKNEYGIVEETESD